MHLLGSPSRLLQLADLFGELPCNELELDVFGVERTDPGRSEAGANRLKAFDGAAELQTFHPNRCESSVSCREDGPHVRAQGVDRALKVLQAHWGHGSARQTAVEFIEQPAERNQLLGDRLVGHTGVGCMRGLGGYRRLGSTRLTATGDLIVA